MKKIYPVISNFITSTTILLGVKPASIFGFHQPRVPKSLK